MRRCLVANRGEIALRIIQACHELNIEAVAVHSTVDADSAAVIRADRAYPLGGTTAKESYLAGERLIEIARDSGCDAIHPGYGFLAENAGFARSVLDAGLTWVGPHPDAMAIMADKTAALTALASTEIPTLPRFHPEEAVGTAVLHEEARRIGFPLLVKAASGGGGRGIRIVHHVDELQDSLSAAQREARRSFGDGRLYLERYLQGARHIEVQIAADSRGELRHFYERDCSVQRRRQKIIEAAPASGISEKLRQRLCQAAITVAETVNYDHLGTVEFLLTEEGEFYFLEMNTRLQVEHPVTELICGVDLVQLQLRLSRGEGMPLTQEEIQPRGHALQCRIYAEAPEEGFRPDTGRISHLAVPTGAGIRWDSALRKGDRVSPHYDSLLGKLVVHDETRGATVQKMACAMRQLAILGVETNQNLLQDLLARPEIQQGTVDTDFVEREFPAGFAGDGAELPAEVWLAAQVLAESSVAVTDEGAPGDGPWDRADRFRLVGGER